MGIAMQHTSPSPKHLFLIVRISLAKPQTLSRNQNARDNNMYRMYVSSLLLRETFSGIIGKASYIYKFAFDSCDLYRRRISRAREDQVERPCAWGDYYWCREEGEKEKEMKEEREKKGAGGRWKRRLRRERWGDYFRDVLSPATPVGWRINPRNQIDTLFTVFMIMKLKRNSRYFRNSLYILYIRF